MILIYIAGLFQILSLWVSNISAVFFRLFLVFWNHIIQLMSSKFIFCIPSSLGLAALCLPLLRPLILMHHVNWRNVQYRTLLSIRLLVGSFWKGLFNVFSKSQMVSRVITEFSPCIFWWNERPGLREVHIINTCFLRFITAVLPIRSAI